MEGPLRAKIALALLFYRLTLRKRLAFPEPILYKNTTRYAVHKMLQHPH